MTKKKFVLTFIAKIFVAISCMQALSDENVIKIEDWIFNNDIFALNYTFSKQTGNLHTTIQHRQDILFRERGRNLGICKPMQVNYGVGYNTRGGVRGNNWPVSPDSLVFHLNLVDAELLKLKYRKIFKRYYIAVSCIKDEECIENYNEGKGISKFSYGKDFPIYINSSVSDRERVLSIFREYAVQCGAFHID